jgi:hypothetical protein
VQRWDLEAIRVRATIGNSDEGPPSLAQEGSRVPIRARNTQGSQQSLYRMR